MSEFEDDIRQKIRERGFATAEILGEIEQELHRVPSAALWILRGDAIQLNNEAGPPLEEAERSYREATALSPASPKAYEELAWYFFLVRDEPAGAEPFARRAIELGGSEKVTELLCEIQKLR
jgi:Flp pilus assembly protein TadD